MTELAGIIILGIFAQWLAWRIKLPAILPLILIGLVVGPISTFWTEDGQKWIEPIYQESINHGLFPGNSLFYFVSLAIGIILFEGGLTLKRQEIKEVGPSILRLISLGSMITFVGAGLATHFIMGLNWDISFLFAALIIVTGPTVIAPILQNVPLTRNVATVLKWEGILIDPIGALVAVLVYEFIVSGGGGVHFTGHALLTFFRIILIGLAMGSLAALALYQFIKREWVPHYLLNVFTLALVLLVFVVSDVLEHECGLLSVVVMGMFLGNLNVPRLNEILYFKESLSVLLISILFILLAANINIPDLELLLDWRCLLLFAFIVLILRPASVFMSIRGADLNTNEKLFVSWTGPRGIVAAGIASLSGIRLLNKGIPGAEYITPLVFMVVLGTVLLIALTARPVAHLLKVIQESSDGILIVGSNAAARLIGKYLQDNKRHVVLIDSNQSNIDKARSSGLEAFQSNIYTDDLDEHFELVDMGFLLSMTSSAEVNQYVCHKFQHNFGEKGTFRLMSPEEMKTDPAKLPIDILFSTNDDYINIGEAARDYPNIHEYELNSTAHFRKVYELMVRMKDSIPLFLKRTSGRLDFLSILNKEDFSISAGDQIVYMGKVIEKVEKEKELEG
ncbi:MAG: sodium:proton antiporter [Bacteroidota bacterium]